MRDFTYAIYKKLLAELTKANYKFVTFAEFVQEPNKKEKAIILRHDVDKKPLQSLRTAEMENELEIKGTYFFRVVKKKLASEVIERIAGLGHEIGYHYDDLNDAGGDIEKALDSFKKNLARLRELASVKTACMHGSPLSKYDNRDLWKNFDYHELGIIGEPYFDVDFNEVMYLTDTGRRWDGFRVSIRDKVIGQRLEAIGYREEKRGDGQKAIGDREDGRLKTGDRGQKEKDCRGAVCDPPALHQGIVDSSQESVVSSQESVVSSQESVDSSKKTKAMKKMKLHSTMDIINALNKDLLPDKIMLTIHPQRWVDNYFLWTKELIWQNLKNGVKYFVARGSS